MALRAVAPPLPEPPPEPLAWGSYSLGTDQSAGLGDGAAVRFTSYQGNLPVDPVTYRIVLPGGKTFRLTAGVLAQFSGTGWCNVNWYNESAAKYIGISGYSLPVSQAANSGMQPTAHGVITTTADTTVYLRIVDQQALTKFPRGQSYGEIMEIR